MTNIIRNLLLAATIAVGAVSTAQTAHAFGFDVDGFSIELGDVEDFGDFEDFEDAEDFADEVEIEIEIDDE